MKKINQRDELTYQNYVVSSVSDIVSHKDHHSNNKNIQS